MHRNRLLWGENWTAVGSDISPLHGPLVEVRSRLFIILSITLQHLSKQTRILSLPYKVDVMGIRLYVLSERYHVILENYSQESMNKPELTFYVLQKITFPFQSVLSITRIMFSWLAPSVQIKCWALWLAHPSGQACNMPVNAIKILHHLTRTFYDKSDLYKQLKLLSPTPHPQEETVL